MVPTQSNKIKQGLEFQIWGLYFKQFTFLCAFQLITVEPNDLWGKKSISLGLAKFSDNYKAFCTIVFSQKESTGSEAIQYLANPSLV